jgi:hypothetical protein
MIRLLNKQPQIQDPSGRYPVEWQATKPCRYRSNHPMDREHFIIAVYCLVCQACQQLRTKYPQLKRRGGFDPALTDEEVITIEVCGEYFKLPPTRTSSTTSARTGATSSPTWGRELCSCGKRLTCGRSKPLFTSTWFRSAGRPRCGSDH